LRLLEELAMTRTIILLLWMSSIAAADSIGRRPDDHASIQHAETVVVGAFTGTTSRRVAEIKNAFDANGRPTTARIEYVVHEFAVTEHLDGPTTLAAISINVPGALAVPAPRRRVVIGVRADGARPEDGYNLVYGRALEADTDARLAELRSWVQTVRAPAPVDPQAIAEAVGLHEAEVRPDEPVAGGPVGPDDPNGPAQPTWVGPPRSAPRVVEPQGDPRHPPEPGAIAAADEASAAASSGDAPSSHRFAAADARAPATGATPPSSSSNGPRRWPYMVGAALLAVLGSLWWRRA